MTGDASAGDERANAPASETESTDAASEADSTDAGVESADAETIDTESPDRAMRADDPPEVSEDFLVEVVKRAPLLALLRDGPQGMNELVAGLDMSRSTVHRATQSLADADLLRNRDGTCELTGFGRVVAEQVADFRAEVAGATKLRSFLNTANPVETDVPVAGFADARVYHPKPRQPHFAVKRIIELIKEADSVSILSSIISPFYVDMAYREMLEGTEIEVVFDPAVVEIIAAEYAEKARKAAETGLFDVLVHDDVPFELFVFDDRVGMAAHDDGGIARVFVESDAPRTVAWAEDLYAGYRERATPIDVDVF